MATYDESSISVLRGIEGLRNNPTMYIGSVDENGLHHLVEEIISNSVDEAMEGFGKRVLVELLPENVIAVEDQGRGIPVGLHQQEGISTLDLVLTEIHAGGKLRNKNGGGYTASGGIHGIGASAVNALSVWLQATVRRDGKVFYREYKAGVPQGRKMPSTKGTSTKTGTRIEFLPDPTIFSETVFDAERISSRLLELSYLTPGVEFVFHNKRDKQNQVSYKTKGGLSDYISSTASESAFPSKPIAFSGQNEHVSLSFAFIYDADADEESFSSYVNSINTPSGGTHVSGFRTALTRVINSIARENKFLSDKDDNLSGDEIRIGIVGALAANLPEPQFEAQTKERLCNPEVDGLVSSMTQSFLSEYFQANKTVLKKIVTLALTNRRAKVAAKKSASLVKQKNGPIKSILPGKLTHCVSRKPQDIELFIVEGDSAAGSAKAARNSQFQAVMPLKGKITNVEKATLDKIVSNPEVETIISACGCGITKGHNFDISNLRYHKIIIATDADVDGQHIRTLLLTFFYRFMRPLIEGGHIYLSDPPLYCLEDGASKTYFKTEADLEKARKKRGRIKRFKGLGEMNVAELRETCMDPASRNLIKIEIGDAKKADQFISLMMGADVEARKTIMRKFKQERSNA